MLEGEVKWFDSRRGYGFISRNDGSDDIFVHYSSIEGPESEYKTLYEGDKVKFDVKESRKGPQADNVEVVEHAPRQSFQSRRYYF